MRRGEELLLDAARVSGRRAGGQHHSDHPAAGDGQGRYRPARGSLQRFSLRRWAGRLTATVRRGNEAHLRRAMPSPGYLLLNRTLEQGKPILGICRGLQFLNVALGGTLYRNLPTEHLSGIEHSMEPPYDQAAHTVRILPDTPLAALLQKQELGVNNCHHQALKTLAPGLAEMACSMDDLIEAVCLPGKTFLWAVQWHPEMSLCADEARRKIFEVFIGAINKK